MSFILARARNELQRRAHDFSRWGDIPLPDGYMTPAQCREYLMTHWEKATKGDRLAWEQGGYKREEVEWALRVLSLEPLPFT